MSCPLQKLYSRSELDGSSGETASGCGGPYHEADGVGRHAASSVEHTPDAGIHRSFMLGTF